MNVDRGATLLNPLDAPAADVGGHGHGRVRRVQCLDHRGDLVDCGPDRRIVAGLEALHLVADAPEQHRRVVLVAQHRPARALELLPYLGLVAVIEAVPLVAEPDADRDAQAQRMRLVEQGVEVVRTPGAHRVGPRGRQRAERARAAGTADEIRFTGTQQLPAIGGLTQFDRNGVC